jgi:tetrahydromethanopterin S-methyltransferase subunit H
MENLSIDHKVGLHAYISDNLGSQIHKLISRWESVRKNKKKHAHKLWLKSLQGDLDKLPVNNPAPEVMIDQTT